MVFKMQQAADYEKYKRVMQYKDALAEWQMSENFCLFGTLTWKYKSCLTEAQRKKALGRFFNALDRKIYKGKGVKEGRRVERFVYFERGKSRQDLHAHFFCKSENLKQTKQIVVEANKFWMGKVIDAEAIRIDTNSLSDERHGYGIKEHWIDDDEQLLVEVCYLKH